MTDIKTAIFTGASLDETQLRVKALEFAQSGRWGDPVPSALDIVYAAQTYLDFLTGTTNRTDS